jgi:3-hydroxybutyryl-CoA dehydrogenase
MALGVAVVGAGTMGIGIAYVFAAAGCAVTVVEPDTARVAAMRRELDVVAQDGRRRGRLDAAVAAGLAQSIQVVDAVTRLPSRLDLVVESVPESIDLKRVVLYEIEQREPLVLATNTSSLSIDELAAGLGSPGRFLGLHFFNPVWSLALVEVVRGVATDKATLARALEFVSLIGKKSAVVRDLPGFATSRLDLVAGLEAIRMVEEGVGEPADIDRAIQLAYRHPVGPLQLSDIVGLDVRLDIARTLEKSLGPRFAPPALLERKVAAGELGRKTGRGFYTWDGERIVDS